MLANILSTIFSWGYLLTGLYSAYQISKKYGFKGKTAWIAGFLSPYSNPGMDFNEISYQTEGEGLTDKVSPIRGLEKSSTLRPMLTTAFSRFSIKIMGNDSDYDSFAKGVPNQSHQKRGSAILSPNGNQSYGTSLSQNESKLNFIDALSPRDSRRLGSSSRKAWRANSNALMRMQLDSANSLSHKGVPANRLLLSENSNLELPSLVSTPNKDGGKTSIVLEESNYDQRRLNPTTSQQSLMFSHDAFTPSEFGFMSPANNDVNRSNNIRRRIKRTLNNMTRTETLDQFSQASQTAMEETNQSPFSAGEEESMNPFQELRDDSMSSTPAAGKRNPKKRIEIRIKTITKSKN